MLGLQHASTVEPMVPPGLRMWVVGQVTALHVVTQHLDAASASRPRATFAALGTPHKVVLTGHMPLKLVHMMGVQHLCRKCDIVGVFVIGPLGSWPIGVVPGLSM
jgi:hypothetical protein